MGRAQDILNKAKEVAGRVKKAFRNVHPEDMDISNSVGHAASQKAGATMSDVAAANRGKRRSNYAKAAGAAAGVAGVAHLLRKAGRAGKTIGAVGKLRAGAGAAVKKIRSMTHGQKAAAGATAAAIGGMTLMRRKKRNKK